MATRRFFTVAALTAVLAGVGAALYGTDRGAGNGEAGNCSAALQTAKAISPDVGGEVAAFQLASRPLNISSLAFKNGDGEEVSLADWIGKTTLVNIWATWCAPCRYEMPALDRLQANRGGDDFQVVAISVDAGESTKPAGFLDEIEAKDLALYHDGTMSVFNQLRKDSLLVGLPLTVMLDENGCVIGHMSGPAEWDSEDALKLINSAVSAGEAQT